MNSTPNSTPNKLPVWHTRLCQLIEQNPRGKAGVAEMMGISRAYVSRVLMTTPNRIKTPSPKFVQRIYDAFGQVDCPYLNRPLTPAQCKTYHERKYIVIDAATVGHWRACQHCSHNPHSQTNTPNTPNTPHLKDSK